MFIENRKHKGIYHKSLNAMIPGVLPPKEVNPNVHFMEIHNSFDPEKLTHEQLVAVAEDESRLSGTDIGETYTVDGVTYPLPSPPIKERLETVRKDIQMYSSKIKRCENLWRKNITKQYLYDQARSALSSGIRSKTLLYILEMRAGDISVHGTGKTKGRQGCTIFGNPKNRTAPFTKSTRSSGKINNRSFPRVAGVCL